VGWRWNEKTRRRMERGRKWRTVDAAGRRGAVGAVGRAVDAAGAAGCCGVLPVETFWPLLGRFGGGGRDDGGAAHRDGAFLAPEGLLVWKAVLRAAAGPGESGPPSHNLIERGTSLRSGADSPSHPSPPSRRRPNLGHASQGPGTAGEQTFERGPGPTRPSHPSTSSSGHLRFTGPVEAPLSPHNLIEAPMNRPALRRAALRVGRHGEHSTFDSPLSPHNLIERA
jgi:hypothetical protein